MAECPLLVLDEIQERGNTSWEDRIITHILDRRYGDLMPTVIIANLTKETLADCLGESIVSRMQETGGVMEITGKSHRIHP
jgi:DNA replication protein DnaC